MSPESFKRKLSAIFSADVVGYSRLMGEDEATTVKTLETYKEVMFTLIKQHRGRVVDATGDNLLAEFGSVVDAVQCAVAVQKELKARNSDLPEDRKMQFRIGINLGDVIEEQDRLYGDGVNIAARLEALADPGFRHGERALGGPGPWKGIALASTAVAAVLALLVVWGLIKPEPELPTTRIFGRIPEDQALLGGFDISPDGSFMVYSGPGETEADTVLWVREWGQREARPIPNSRTSFP